VGSLHEAEQDYSSFHDEHCPSSAKTHRRKRNTLTRLLCDKEKWNTRAATTLASEQRTRIGLLTLRARKYVFSTSILAIAKVLSSCMRHMSSYGHPNSMYEASSYGGAHTTLRAQAREMKSAGFANTSLASHTSSSKPRHWTRHLRKPLLCPTLQVISLVAIVGPMTHPTYGHLPGNDRRAAARASRPPVCMVQDCEFYYRKGLLVDGVHLTQ
jgi:hypothetical protein